MNWKMLGSLLVLGIAAITDIKGREIPNELIVVASIISTLCVGVSFIIRFILALSISLIFKGKGLGNGDKKLLSWLFGVYGFCETYLFSLLFSFILFILTYLFISNSKGNKKTDPLAPSILGGFLCVGLLQL